jgi:hypothetical protein
MQVRECPVCGAEANEPCRDFCPVDHDGADEDYYFPSPVTDTTTPSPWDNA